MGRGRRIKETRMSIHPVTVTATMTRMRDQILPCLMDLFSFYFLHAFVRHKAKPSLQTRAVDKEKGQLWSEARTRSFPERTLEPPQPLDVICHPVLSQVFTSLL
ncbi:hypothetical protein AVEN_251008-1 [Araneus ventricosus]|uniref:Uncharacterized protein n=1 Tax=Araneus ventricosus TaxID=182803 RepID=A0A4Y2FHA8_ARAVE|nr:hypothetical protein AVEN_251008-1 [Araneus ventricosus]